MSGFLQQVVSGLAAGGVYGSLALALVLIHRATGVVNFAQGEMATFTTYVAWTLTVSHGVPYWPAVLITLTLAFAGGVGIHQTMPSRSPISDASQSPGSGSTPTGRVFQLQEVNIRLGRVGPAVACFVQVGTQGGHQRVDRAGITQLPERTTEVEQHPVPLGNPRGIAQRSVDRVLRFRAIALVGGADSLGITPIATQQ